MSSSEQDRLQQIVAMAVMQVPDGQIAEAVGLSPGRITQIKDTEEYKQLFAEHQGRRMHDIQELDDGWDGIEKSALKIVADNLRWNKNPDYALKAATLANRAARRGQSGMAPALPGDMGPRVVVQLNPTFINKLQQINASSAATEPLVTETAIHSVMEKAVGVAVHQQVTITSQGFRKQSDVMMPAQVEALLGTRLPGEVVLDFDLELVQGAGGSNV